MPVRAVDDKPSDTLVVVSGEGFWTGSSTLPHLHHSTSFTTPWLAQPGRRREPACAHVAHGLRASPQRPPAVRRPNAISATAQARPRTTFPTMAMVSPTVTDSTPISGA